MEYVYMFSVVFVSWSAIELQFWLSALLTGDWIPGYINSPVNVKEKNHLERIIKQLTFH